MIDLPRLNALQKDLKINIEYKMTKMKEYFLRKTNGAEHRKFSFGFDQCSEIKTNITNQFLVFIYYFLFASI